MPFSEKLITVIVSCEEGIQEKHLPFLERLATQVAQTKETVLHVGTLYGTSTTTQRLRQLNTDGLVSLLLETKNPTMVRKLQHTLLINVRTPYTLFLDPSTNLKEQALSILEQFTLKHSPLLLSGRKSSSSVGLDARCVMVNTMLMRQSNILSSKVEYFSDESLSERIQQNFGREGITPYYWNESLSTLFECCIPKTGEGRT